MKGFQVVFFFEQDQRKDHKSVVDWLVDLAKKLDITGATVFSGQEGFGRAGRMHSRRFIELADQPVQVMMTITEGEVKPLFDAIKDASVDLFYIKTPVEFGRTVSGEPGHAKDD